MNYSFEEKLYIWLSNAFELGVSSANKLIELNGGIINLYNAVLDGTAILPEGRGKKENFALRSSMSRIDAFIEGMEEHSVRAITRVSKGYPKSLNEIYDPPLVLYERGNKCLRDVSFPFAIIGARHCTEYGERMSTVFGRTLADYNMTIVSGLAYGCDSMAAQGALKSENSDIPTVAVLGQGVLVDKHDSTARIMEEIIDRGVVISEMLPNSAPSKISFPMRNRIISGISKGLLVVEAGEKSGTMITANAAMEQGRIIFSIPGRINDRMSFGTNSLIKCGAARMVYEPAEILDYYGLISPKDVVRESGNKVHEMAKSLDGDSKILYDLLFKGEKSFDALCELSKLSPDKLNLYLTELEFSGLIKQLPGRVYVAE